MARGGRGYQALPAGDDQTPNAARERLEGGDDAHADGDHDRVQLNAGGASSSDQVESDTEEEANGTSPPRGTTSRQQSVETTQQQESTERRVASTESPQQEQSDRKTESASASAGERGNNEAESSSSEEATEPAAEAPLEPGFIRVRILDLNGKFFNIACQLEWTVARLKEKVLECTEVAMASQRLIYRGRVLEDDKVLDDYKLEDGHTVHLFVRMNPNPEPEPAATEAGAAAAPNGANTDRFADGTVHIVHITSDTISSAVFPSDSARRVDPLMLDSPLGNCARRVKLWSSFLLIIYTMKVMGQFALLANDQQMRAEEKNKDDTNGQDRYYDRYDYPPYYNQDPMVSAVELMVHAFGVYVGCVGFKAAHDTDIRPIRFYCRGIVWLAVLTIAEQIYVTYQISQSDYPETRIQYPYGAAAPSKDDVVSANVFQTMMLVVMWIIAIIHSYAHQAEVARYNESFAAAAMNAVPPAHLPEVV